MPSPEANRRNLELGRAMGRVRLWRSRDQTKLVKLAVYQEVFDSVSPRKSQRTLARELQVSQPYICRLMRQAAGYLNELAAYRMEHGPVTSNDLLEAQRHSQRMLASLGRTYGLAETSQPERPVMLDEDAMIAEQWRRVREWRRHGR